MIEMCLPRVWLGAVSMLQWWAGVGKVSRAPTDVIEVVFTRLVQRLEICIVELSLL